MCECSHAGGKRGIGSSGSQEPILPRLCILINAASDRHFKIAPEAPDVARFVEFLENWVIKILADFGIKAGLKKGMVGIWVGDKKVAALGIKLKKWVSYHGIAINIDPDMAGFRNIVPCGIKEFGVTSMREILDEKIDEEKFLNSVKKNV